MIRKKKYVFSAPICTHLQYLKQSRARKGEQKIAFSHFRSAALNATLSKRTEEEQKKAAALIYGTKRAASALTERGDDNFTTLTVHESSNMMLQWQKQIDLRQRSRLSFLRKQKKSRKKPATFELLSFFLSFLSVSFTNLTQYPWRRLEMNARICFSSAVLGEILYLYVPTYKLGFKYSKHPTVDIVYLVLGGNLYLFCKR